MSSAARRRGRALATIPARIAGRYEPLAKIAAGGMATVFLARLTTEVGFGKLVALKCVHPHMVDDLHFVEMFLDEARIASRIDHPNVCTVFDAGEDEGTHYLAMEYLHGEPLSALIKRVDAQPSLRSARWPTLAARVISDAAMGLHAAHELVGARGESLGLVHRDVSPQNLFLTYDGSVKVVDFGIAKAAGRLHETTTGVVKGKVAYMSPEQLHAEALDRRTDVWALGVTLWEMLTFRRLFKKDEQLKTLQAVLDAEVPAPSSLEPSVPKALDALVLAALDRDRAGRPESARAFADGLNAFIARGGEHVGLSELADLMGSAFVKERAEKDAFVRSARESHGRQPGLAPPPPGSPEGTHSEVRPTQRVQTETVELPVRRHGPLLGVGVAVLAAIGGAVGLGVLASEEEPSEATVAAAPELVDPPREPEPVAEDLPEGLEPPPDTLPVESPPDEAPRPREPARPRTERAPRATKQAPAVERPASPRTFRVVHPGGGWAELRVNGRRQRNSPGDVAGVRPGRVRVELRPYGQGPWQSRTIDLPEGDGAFVVRLPLPPP